MDRDSFLRPMLFPLEFCRGVAKVAAATAENRTILARRFRRCKLDKGQITHHLENPNLLKFKESRPFSCLFLQIVFGRYA